MGDVVPALCRRDARSRPFTSNAGGNDFQVVAVSLDRGGKAMVERWNAQAGIKHLTIHNANPADFPGALLPTSILLDKQGRVAWTGTGIYAWTEEEAISVIKAVMAE